MPVTITNENEAKLEVLKNQARPTSANLNPYVQDAKIENLQGRSTTTLTTNKDQVDLIRSKQNKDVTATFTNENQEARIIADQNIKRTGIDTRIPTLDNISGAIKKSFVGLILLNRLKKGDGIGKAREELNQNYITKEQARQSSRAQIFADYYKNASALKDSIIISNLDAGTFQGEVGYDTIILPAWPKELSYTPNSNFVAIASIARNNPHYNYVGSEDTLEFKIDWYTTDSDRDKVIKGCRKIEALTKADGYKAKPPRVMIQWGAQDRLFNGQQWIVVAAPYTMSQFARAYHTEKALELDSGANTSKATRIGSMPQQAIQTITLKRVTNHNLTHREIRKVKSGDNGLEALNQDLLSTNANNNITA
jgi:hypothetical protein